MNTRMTIKPYLACSALAIACASPLAAASPESHGCRHAVDLDRLSQRAEARFAAADADADSRVSLAEFKAAASSRKGQRRGRRGRRHHAGDAETRNAHRQARRQALFASLDTDGNQQLSAQEFSKLSETKSAMHRQAAFKRLDTDANGELSSAELNGRLARMRERDSDGDGQLSCDER